MTRQVILSMALFAAMSVAEARVKFIAHGWDTMDMDPTTILANADALDKTAINGITIALPVRRQTDGTEANFWRLPFDGPWKYETFADQVPILQKIVKHPSLRDSFLLCSFSRMKGRIKWTDDAEWGRFSNNMRVLSRIAKAGGMKGLFLDNEDYTNILQYKHRPEECDFKTACKLARRRGREIFSGVFEAFPNAVIMPFWLLTQVKDYARSSDPVASMEADGCLWPAFVNGLFDVLPPTARVVDGNEYAYTYEYNDGAFARSAVDQLIGLLPLVAKENRAKYRAQMSVSFGQYIDMYTHDNPSSTWYFGPVEGSRLEHFRRNITEAAACADEYVWLYGEQFSWIKWNNPPAKSRKYRIDRTWEEALPGVNAMLKAVRNPGASLHELVATARAKGASSNRFPEALANEDHWQNPKCIQGTFSKDPTAGVGGTLTMTGIVNGCFELPVEVNPGETWVVDMYMTGFAGERQNPSIAFRDGAKKWHWDLGTTHATLQAADNVGRRRASAVVRVPAGMRYLVLMLNGGQKNGETATFTDIFIAKCESSLGATGG